LVLYSNARLIPANILFDQAIREALTALPDRQVTVLDAFLDAPYFTGPAYEDTYATYLRGKYASHRPDVIIAGGEDALRFLIRNRARLFPEVPIVHMAVSRSLLRSLAPVPPDVVGIPSDLNVPATIEQALRWHPQAKRVVVVTGASQWDRGWEVEVREGTASFRDRVAIEALAGLPLGAVLKRLGELGKDAVVFTPGFFEDGSHQVMTPRESIRAMVAASTAPVYVPFPVHLGSGVVGGYMWGFDAAGSQVGKIVRRLLDGEPPSSIQLPDAMPAILNVDWRQMKRWGIDETTVPAGAVVHSRVPTFLEEHRLGVVVVIVGFLLQSALIAVLLVERRRRRSAEQAGQKQASALAHASRVALAGELTGAIAHEINQPLGAILANAEAAELILASNADRRETLREIVADIRKDDLRASEVIRRLRGLLAKHEVEQRPFDVNDALRDAESILGSEAGRRGVTIMVRPLATAATIVGDQVQIQQVLINLLLNAMDAVAGRSEDRRTIVLSAESIRDKVVVAVHDRGRGIAPVDLPKVFESFFSTKTTGMGLGLSVANSLVRAHGGRIWVESDPGEGTVFRVELPLENELGPLPPEQS
jgi:signal transduction histidine kinase